MFKKKCLILMMIVIISVSIIGCDFGNGNGANGEEEAVWEVYSTSDFGIKYPGEWYAYKTTEWVDGYGFMDFYLFSDVRGEEARPYFSIFIYEDQLEGLTEPEKSEFIDLLGNALAEEISEDDNDILLSTSKTIVDGQSAYQILSIRYRYGEENSKEKMIISYNNNDIYFFSYADREGSYNNTVEIGKRMLNSFEFLR